MRDGSWRPALLSLIFFLTGCARTEYHKTQSHPRAASIVSYAFEAGQTPDFGWPAPGKVTRYFGAREGGAPRKGVTVRTAPGAEVTASAAGTVGFVDPSLEGYGSTVVIEHSAEYATVIAGLTDLSVSAGQSVRKGERLGKAAVGTDGACTYYFEIRRHARAEDPLSRLSV
ncbi:MAG: hypothetical protein MOGMAGMI_00898 [Candidatus Omnitrophica bacterium]|nr:hypothetical protein [Candidatus Omnitrophota bacterium]